MPPLPKNIVKHLTSITMEDENKTTALDNSSHKKNMTLECNRLETFKNVWPLNFLSPSKMAAAGFYFLRKTEDGKYRDDVKCSFCGIEVGKWVQGDDPLKDHEKWSPNCWFLRRLKRSSGNSENPGYDTCGSLLIEPPRPRSDVSTTPGQVSSLEKLGLQKNSPPAFPAYATYESRLRSFDTWPISLKLKPDVLTEAGFFYTGKSDQTICFRCGGGLKDWEETDDPWVEHTRWFSQCPYIKLVKGQEFIHGVIGYKETSNDPITLQDLETVVSAHSEVAPAPTLSETQPGSSSSCSLAVESTSTSCSSMSPALPTTKTPSPAASSESNCASDDLLSKGDYRLCKICYQREMGVVFLPCGHIVACVICASTLSVCAVCRQKFTATVRAFLS